MPYELFLALRYLRPRGGGAAGRRWATARVTALVAVVGVACGVAALVVAFALANGFREELRDKILRGTAHVTLSRADGRAIEDWRQLVETVRGVPGVVDAAPTSYAGALLSGPDGEAYAVVRGVERSSGDVAEIGRTLVAGAVEPLSRMPANAGGTGVESPADVIIGVGLAGRVGLTRVGEKGWLVMGERSSSSSLFLPAPNFVPRARRVRVAGFFRTGLHDYDDSWVYSSLGTAAEVMGAPDESAQVVSVETEDIYYSAEVAMRLRAALGSGFTAIDWQEANRPLFAALALERRMVAFIIALIMLVAALNITTTLTLLVVERRADIAILGALGARARGVMLVFVLEGALVGLAGALAGVALGLSACYLGNRYGLVSLPAEVYSLSHIPLRPRAGETMLAALAAFLICLIATVYPARAASRVRPAEALRYE